MTPELEDATKQADAELDALQEQVRAAAKAVNRIAELSSTVQRHAQDAEFTVEAACRSCLDGNLLQRTSFVNTVAADLAGRLRSLAQGIRDLKGDCAEIHSGQYKERLANAEKRVAERAATN